MDLPGESEPRRRKGRRNPAVITRRNPLVDTMYAVGIIFLQASSWCPLWDECVLCVRAAGETGGCSG
ncbi:hypothetical protein JOQ06_020206, partial [Pogonophryne albipinna]